MRRFKKFRDDRFALTTLQNPLCEVRTYAELCQAAQRERENQQMSAEIRAPQPPVAQWAPDAVAPAALATDDPPIPPDQPAAAPAPLAQPAAIATGAQAPQPPNRQTTGIIRPVRKPVRKFSKPRPKLKSSRHSKKVQLAEVVPSGDASKYVTEIFDRRFTNSESPRPENQSELAALERHARKCAICNHPNRADLEQDFVSWRNADLIKKDYDLPNFRTIYTHARATGLYQRRRENLRFAAELLIEHADQAQPGPDTILRAIHTCAHLTGSGAWVEPIKRVIFSSGNNIVVTEPNSAPQSLPESSPQQIATEIAAHPQLSAPLSSSTDEPNTNP
jgi:hypothetical protein